MIVYISRDGTGAINGMYANRQQPTDTAIDDGDPEVVAYIASLQPKTNFPDLDALKAIAAQALADIASYQAVQDNGTTAQIAARDHIALKGAVQDLKLIIKYLMATFG